MTETNVDIKSINELLQYNFFIPSYQRGYRWKKQEVEDLLKDINEFTSKEIENTENRTWYCLQPLVIKKCNELTKEKFTLNTDNDWYEVIDGQQRLTTIFLIIHYINEMWKGKSKLKEIQLRYETRNDSWIFLNQLMIDEKVNNIEINKNNIDFYYISKIYESIHNWFELNPQLDTSNFESKFIHYTKVIWYETLSIDSIDIFTRINMGKIPLTNAELIKALFLNSSNFKKKSDLNCISSDKVRLIQLEIASEWDRIEYSLQNDSFWYFLNKSVNSQETRIEFIFDLMSNKPLKKDVFFTFRYFSEKFKRKTEEEIIENWKEIKNHFQMLEEWFTDRVLYHQIGFLIATGIEINKLIILAKLGKSKKEFRISLIELIKEKVDVQLTTLEYGKGPINNVLLLHNVQTMLNNIDETNLFPFDRYKKEKWDVEHISALAEDMPQTERYQRDWLKESSQFISDPSLKNKSLEYDQTKFKDLYSEILLHFSNSERYEGSNDISNLALLDANTNRGYGNAAFPVKRSKIIEKDIQGTFIPICTKNLFMKFYNNDVSQMTFWGKDDRKAYLKNIKDTLEYYLPEQIKIENEQ